MTTGHVLTANRLIDGLVVFLTPANTWSRDIDDAVMAKEPYAKAGLEKRGTDFETSNAVTGAYLVEATRLDDGTIIPSHVRERIRACGPTVDYLADESSACADAIAT